MGVKIKYTFIVSVLLLVATIGWAALLQADFNRDGIVDFEDFSIFANEWLQTEDLNSYPLLQEHCDANTDNVSLAVDNYNFLAAQTFTVNQNYTITSVMLKLCRVNSPGIITVSICSTTNGVPTNIVLCSGETDGDTLIDISPYEWREVLFDANYALQNGIVYAIVVQASGIYPINYIQWRGDNPSECSNGRSFQSGDGGATWELRMPSEKFETYGE